MTYYYDKEGEVILESMQEMYYKMDLMSEDSKSDYEQKHPVAKNNSHKETSHLAKILEEKNQNLKEAN